jgi:hypothetical protein
LVIFSWRADLLACKTRTEAGFKGSAVSARPDTPDIQSIADHSRTMLRSGEASKQTTLQALRLVEENLRRDYGVSDEALKPITDLIDELQRREPNGDVQCSHP